MEQENQKLEQMLRLIPLTRTEMLELRRLIRGGVKTDLAVAKVAGLTLKEIEESSYRIVPRDE